MTRATSPVGSRFAPCPPKHCGVAKGGHAANSNRNKVRIEIAVTYSKQTRGTNSNRNSFRGVPRIAERILAADEAAHRRIFTAMEATRRNSPHRSC
jgi:hypothetical protein